MEKTLLSIAVILIATKIGGIISKKLKMPEVLGALIAGVLLGPTLLNLIDFDSDLKLLSNLGVIILMFLAGVETNLDEFKKAGLSAFVIACGGILLPLVFGTLSAFLFFPDMLANVFIGVILTATSVSITAQTLSELGHLNSRAGVNILGAAVIDDILGLILISVLLAVGDTGSGGSAASVYSILIQVAIFCAAAILAILFLPRLLKKRIDKVKPGATLLAFALAAALLCAFAAESLGIAAITGAYLCGLLFSQFGHKEWLERNVKSISSGFLAPIFFASVGIETDLKGMTLRTALIMLVMFAVAVLGKIFGCGFAARLFKMEKSEALQIGIGMVSRGEVAIITANIGLHHNIISTEIYMTTIFVVILTTVLTPILLKFSFSHKLDRNLR